MPVTLRATMRATTRPTLDPNPSGGGRGRTSALCIATERRERLEGRNQPFG